MTHRQIVEYHSFVTGSCERHFAALAYVGESVATPAKYYDLIERDIRDRVAFDSVFAAHHIDAVMRLCTVAADITRARTRQPQFM
jgi:UDP-glucose 4-epimerase